MPARAGTKSNEHLSNGRAGAPPPCEGALQPPILGWAFPQARKATSAAHQGGNLMEEAEPPKENVDPKRFSWLECEPLPLPQLREGRGAVPSRGDVIFAIFAALSQCSLTVSDSDSSLVRIGPLPDGRVCGVAAFLCVRSCLAVEPSMPYLRSVASPCPADKGGCARRADDGLRCCPWIDLSRA